MVLFFNPVTALLVVLHSLLLCTHNSARSQPDYGSQHKGGRNPYYPTNNASWGFPCESYVYVLLGRSNLCHNGVYSPSYSRYKPPMPSYPRYVPPSFSSYDTTRPHQVTVDATITRIPSYRTYPAYPYVRQSPGFPQNFWNFVFQRPPGVDAPPQGSWGPGTPRPSWQYVIPPASPEVGTSPQVAWLPGAPRPSWQNVIPPASPEVSTPPQVAWLPGAPRPSWQNVIPPASPEVGTPPQVAWLPGAPRPSWQNVISPTSPEVGTPPQVVWLPGAPRPSWQNVIPPASPGVGTPPQVDRVPGAPRPSWLHMHMPTPEFSLPPPGVPRQQGIHPRAVMICCKMQLLASLMKNVCPPPLKHSIPTSARLKLIIRSSVLRKPKPPPVPNKIGTATLAELNEVCGVSKAPIIRVVGGIESTLGAWPWMAALFIGDKASRVTSLVSCGGVLISDLYVLTASHCVVDNATGKAMAPSEFLVRLGDLDISLDTDGARPVDFNVVKAQAHENYNPTTIQNDIALLKLDKPATFSESIRPICIPTVEMKVNNFENMEPHIAGWGTVEFRGNSSSVLRQVQVQVQSNTACQTAYDRFRITITKSQLCAGFRLGGKDACQGDSGGPLMFPLKNKWYTIGVVSVGFKCAEPGFPGIYCRTTEYLDWITKNAELN